MRKLLLVALALALAGTAGAQDIQFKPASGGGAATALTPNTTTASPCANDPLVVDGSGIVQCGNAANYFSRVRKLYTYIEEFSAGAPFTSSATVLASGTSTQTGDANHPGYRITTSSTSANSGVSWYIQTNGSTINGLLLQAGARFEVIFQPKRFTTTVFRAGFLNVVNPGTAAAPHDGCWLDVDTTGLISGICAKNDAPASTGTTFQTVLDTWYRGVVNVNSASSVTFTLYSAADSQLWTDTFTTAANIPTAVGRETGAGVVNYHTGTGTAFALSYLDLFMVSSGPLTR